MGLKALEVQIVQPLSINQGSAGSRRSPAWRYTSPAQAQGVQAEEGWGNVGVSGLSKSSCSDHTAGKEPHGSFSSGRQAVARAAAALVRRASVDQPTPCWEAGFCRSEASASPGPAVQCPHPTRQLSALRRGHWQSSERGTGLLIQNVSVGHRCCPFKRSPSPVLLELLSQQARQIAQRGTSLRTTLRSRLPSS